MIDTSKLRRFTETDWYAWAGATPFADNSDPYIFEKSFSGAVDFTLIIGREGIDIVLTPDEISEDESEQMSWLYPREFEDAEEARRFAIKLLEDLDIDGDICAADISYCLDKDSRFLSPIKEG